MAYIDVVTADAPRAHFKFDGNTTNSGATGTVSGAPAGYKAGIGTGAAEFTGSQTVFASTGTMNGFGSQSSSIAMECWVRTESTSEGVLLRVSSGVGGTGGGGYTYRLGMLADGRAYFRFEYQNLAVFSNAAINDGEWHHVVGVGVYNQVRVFVDGVKATSTTTNYGGGISNPKFYVGSAGDSMHFDGVIDEAAVYNKELTDARVTAHYNAGLSEVPGAPVPVEVNLAEAATTSLTTFDVDVEASQVIDLDATAITANAHDASVSLPTTVEVDAPSMSLSGYDVEVETQFVYFDTVLPTADYMISGSSIEDTNPLHFNHSSDRALFLMDKPAAFRDNGKVSVNFYMESAGRNATQTYEIAAITSPVTDPFNITEGPSKFLSTDDWVYNFDVTDIVDNNFYGFVVKVPFGGSEKIYPSEAGEALSPKAVFAYEMLTEGTGVDVEAATSALQAPEASVGIGADTDLDTAAVNAQSADVEIGTGVGVSVPEASIALDAPDVTLGQAVVDVDAAVVVLEAPDAVGSIPVVVDLDVAGITLDVNETETIVAYNARINAEPAKMSIRIRQFVDVNGEPPVEQEDEDPYFNAVMFSQPDIWYRFNDLAGPVKPRVWYTHPTPSDYATSIPNAVFGRGDGPNGRRYVHFNGTAMFTQPGEPNFKNDDEATDNLTPRAIEFSLRTAKRTQFIMRMDDYLSGGGFMSGSDLPAVDLYMNKGRLEVRKYRAWNSTEYDVVFTSYADLSDDKWHHVVLAYEPDRRGDRYSVDRINLYVDGHLDIRRYTSLLLSFPDYIGGRSTFHNFANYAPLPQTQWFVGDMAEVVYYVGTYFNEDMVNRNYDTLIGRDPVYLEAATVEMNGEEPTIKSNKTRMLVLDFGGGHRGGSGATYPRSVKPIENDDFTFDRSSPEQARFPVQFSFDGYGKFVVNDFDTIRDNWVRVGRQKPWDHDGMLLYNISTMVDYDNAGSYYLDERLDTPRLIDLEKDLNMDDYDVISIVDFPQGELGPDYGDADEGVEFGAPTAVQQFERLIEQVRKEVVNGKNLMLADPASAIALGIIDKVDYVPNYRERVSLDSRMGAVTGLFDAYGVNGKRGPALDEMETASRYNDQHANMFQTVRNIVPGLTDVKGFWIHSDSSLWRNLDPFATPNAVYKYRHEDRTETGLLLGDEFYVRGNGDLNPIEQFWDRQGSGTPRSNGWVATPIDHIKAGVAVTTFSNRVGMKDKMVDNPYKDHAVSIAVRPGDTLKGDTIAGKVYVNFTEAYVNWATAVDTMPREIIPEDGWDRTRRFHVSEFDRYWTYSETRGLWVGDSITFTAPIDNSNWDSLNTGEVVSAGNRGNNKKTFQWKWAMMNYRSAFEMEEITSGTMANRALLWLTEDIDVDGNAAVGIRNATVSAEAKDVTVSTTETVEITLGAARVNVDVQPMPDVVQSDVTVLLTTPTVRLDVKPLTETVELEPAKVILNAPEVENDLLASVDRIYVTMPVHNITLILEED